MNKNRKGFRMNAGMIQKNKHLKHPEAIGNTILHAHCVRSPSGNSIFYEKIKKLLIRKKSAPKKGRLQQHHDLMIPENQFPVVISKLKYQAGLLTSGSLCFGSLPAFMQWLLAALPGNSDGFAQDSHLFPFSPAPVHVTIMYIADT
jgi:hypothetical protein